METYSPFPNCEVSDLISCMQSMSSLVASPSHVSKSLQSVISRFKKLQVGNDDWKDIFTDLFFLLPNLPRHDSIVEAWWNTVLKHETNELQQLIDGGIGYRDYWQQADLYDEEDDGINPWFAIDSRIKDRIQVLFAGLGCVETEQDIATHAAMLDAAATHVMLGYYRARGDIPLTA